MLIWCQPSKEWLNKNYGQFNNRYPPKLYIVVSPVLRKEKINLMSQIILPSVICCNKEVLLSHKFMLRLWNALILVYPYFYSKNLLRLPFFLAKGKFIAYQAPNPGMSESMTIRWPWLRAIPIMVLLVQLNSSLTAFEWEANNSFINEKQFERIMIQMFNLSIGVAKSFQKIVCFWNTKLFVADENMLQTDSWKVYILSTQQLFKLKQLSLVSQKTRPKIRSDNHGVEKVIKMSKLSIKWIKLKPFRNIWTQIPW